MDTVAHSSGLSTPARDPLGDEAVAAWVGRQLAALEALREMAYAAAQALTRQVGRGGRSTASCSSGAPSRAELPIAAETTASAPPGRGNTRVLHNLDTLVLR